MWKKPPSARCGRFGIEATRKQGFPGVWVGGSKIASLGIAASPHNPARTGNERAQGSSLFNIITPCGLDGITATSVQREQTGDPASMDQVKRCLLEAFCQVFGQTMPPLQSTQALQNLLAGRP